MDAGPERKCMSSARPATWYLMWCLSCVRRICRCHISGESDEILATAGSLHGFFPQLMSQAGRQEHSLGAFDD
eukprot:9480903-Pyramimonas_sp.AAC.1